MTVETGAGNTSASLLHSDAVQPGDELTRLLRPAGGGLYLVSTGRADQQSLQRRLYGVTRDDEVELRWRESLHSIASARAILIGIPSDVGAGFMRGANLAPMTLRAALLDQDRGFLDRAREAGLLDVGDVLVVPQLLHDDMLADGQKQATRRALYPDLPDADLPVSPLSMAERALDLVFTMNPGVRPIVMGGDHSTAWPVVSALARARDDRWAIVQSDAHTDLLAERLGVRYCFATWSFHANQLLGADGRLVQVGIRASRHDRAHWESTTKVRQFWADQCRTVAAIDDIVAHLRSVGVTSVYFSNDIDGTDSAYADATGTPEPGGLSPEFVIALIDRLGREFGLCGGDLMEVAPLLARRPDSTERTVALAVRYLRQTIATVLGIEP